MLVKNYQEAISWLFEQFPSYQNKGPQAYKPGLENTLALAKAFGHPEKKLKFVHVAGSNGKGSTCSFLASGLSEAGYKVGLFTSPHLLDFRERIRVNGLEIDEHSVVDFCRQIQQLELIFKPSFFEITWVMALEHFIKSQCDVCVIETGLGGRLDSTNIVHPELSIITNISLEHTQFLGDTIEAIAAEKAGIIKSGVPVVVGERQPECEEVFFQKATENIADLTFASDENHGLPADFPFLGDYLRKNYRTARTACHVLSKSFPKFNTEQLNLGLHNLHKNTGFKGRMQVISKAPRVILDVAHNSDGIRNTLSFFQKEIKKNKLRVLYGTSADKNLQDIFENFPKNVKYYFSAFQNERSISMEIIQNEAIKKGFSFSCFENVESAYLKALNETAKDETPLLFGSFFLIEEFLILNA